MTKAELIHDEAPHSKYFHTLPNMYDDDLNPYEYRLIGHFKRVGVSWEGTRKIADKTKMSIGMVGKTRKSLEDKGLIRVEFLTRKDLKERGFVDDKKPEEKTQIAVVFVVDVMEQNIARYSKGNNYAKGVHVVNTPVHTVNTPVHVVNERITNEEKQTKKGRGAKAPTPSKTHPLIQEWIDIRGLKVIDIGAPIGGTKYSAAAKRMAKWTTPPTPDEIRIAIQSSKSANYDFTWLETDIPKARLEKANAAVAPINPAHVRVEPTPDEDAPDREFIDITVAALSQRFNAKDEVQRVPTAEPTAA